MHARNTIEREERDPEREAACLRGSLCMQGTAIGVNLSACPNSFLLLGQLYLLHQKWSGN